ncbi:MAG: Do family serine endopeptidase [Rickettsiales bacterium]
MKKRNASLLALAYVCLALHGRQGEARAAEKRVPDSEATVFYSYAPLVKSAAPAVVNIYSKKTVPPRYDDMFSRLFLGNDRNGGSGAQSLGSGVMVDPEGLIVTCYHVIEDSDKITVVLNDRREYDASVAYQDKKTDLALLSVNTGGKPMPHIALMDSDDLEVGDVVLAIGNPFGVGQTVTSGIVSALARSSVGVSDYQFFIQTDASINPGNSGGALIDMQGRLAGINTAIYSRTGGSNGIGFAIPSNMVRAVVASVQGYGRVVRPWLGVKTQDLTRDVADSLGLNRPLGALITGIYPSGPAERSGLKVGDVVIKIGDHEVPDQHALQFRIATLRVGTQSHFAVYRNGKFLKLPIRLEPAPETPPREARLLQGRHPFNGATVVNISPAVAEEMDLPYDAKGVAVQKVEGSAALAGIREKDVILEVNGADATSTSQLDRALRSANSRSWRATVRRDNNVVTLSWML